MTTHEGAPWRALRDLEPSLGSKRRVLANIHAELDHASARRPAPARTLVFAAAAIAAVAALWLTVPAAAACASPRVA